MSHKVFVAIDTNILVRAWTQGKPGCEMEHWNKLQAKCESGDVTMLVSEVVLLEAEKKWQAVVDDIDAKLEAVRQSVEDMFRKPHDWSEIKNVGESLAKEVTRHREEKKKNARINHDIIDSYIRSSDRHVLHYTEEVWFKAKKRLLGGRFPKAGDRNPEADCVIVESLALYFRNNPCENAQLLFCSENLSDFGVEVGSKNYSFHPSIKEGLPPARIFLDLRTLVEFISADSEVVEPSKTEVEKAVERDREEVIEHKAQQMGRSPSDPRSIVLDELQSQILGFLFSHYFSSGGRCSYHEIQQIADDKYRETPFLSIALDYLIEAGLVEINVEYDDFANAYFQYSISNEGKNWCRSHSELFKTIKPKAKPSKFAGLAIDDDDDDIPF